MPRNLLYAQSGGVTAVINASAAGVITAARRHPGRIGKVFAARHGIQGVLREDLLDTSSLSVRDVEALKSLPGGAFGSCRMDLDPFERNPAQFERLFAVLEAHDIGVLLYNGGNGSMETARQIGAAARQLGHSLQVIGVPKTVDNDIVATDCCPGFGSAAKYLATSVREAGLDVEAMTTSGGRVFVLEVMGRNAGWLAAACSLAARTARDAPHLVLMPEVPFDEPAFLSPQEIAENREKYR
ncbi:MAG: diphosphate--fructose-6-phosphate 1-phosphotransferase, partial [Zoogloea sp.]|nr:diphosphate--fructose-6-phosphate 1-phosphotransferase [Zoogloea sp.]